MATNEAGLEFDKEAQDDNKPSIFRTETEIHNEALKKHYTLEECLVILCQSEVINRGGRYVAIQYTHAEGIRQTLEHEIAKRNGGK